MSIFSRASLQGSSDERDMGGPSGKVSTAQSPDGAPRQMQHRGIKSEDVAQQ